MSRTRVTPFKTAMSIFREDKGFERGVKKQHQTGTTITLQSLWQHLLLMYSAVTEYLPGSLTVHNNTCDPHDTHDGQVGPHMTSTIPRADSTEVKCLGLLNLPVRTEDDLSEFETSSKTSNKSSCHVAAHLRISTDIKRAEFHSSL